VSIHSILGDGTLLIETHSPSSTRRNLMAEILARRTASGSLEEPFTNGENPDIENVNAQYQGLEFHYIYLMIMAYLVWLIIPGIGFLYSGLSRRKSALAMLFQSFAVMGVYVGCYCSSNLY
jgi:hypothetical protein